MPSIEFAITSTLALVAGFFATIAGSLLGQLDPIQPLVGVLTGPLGGLVFCLFAVRYLLGRLNKAEERYSEREKERDKDRKLLIQVLEENSAALRDVREVIENCPKKE